MALPENFQFSQSSLQDYVDCPRRFQLRYIQHRAWPALESEQAMDNELFMQRGSQFHQMAHQYLLGVPEEKIANQFADDEVIQRWWQNFTHIDLGGFGNLSGLTLPEVSLSAPIDDYRIMAKYDLLFLKNLSVSADEPETSSEPDDPKEFEAIIYDWKTSLKRPKRQWLVKKLQSKVYPYILVKTGAQIAPQAGNPIAPEQIEMIYWYTDYPDQPAHFPYSQEQFETDEAYLSNLIAEIKTLGDEDAQLTEDERRCQYCNFRSLCNRGVEAGPLADADSDWSDSDGFKLDLDFEHVAEIEF